MSWDRKPVAVALVELLEPLDPTVTVHEAPPSTFNPPAMIVWYPTTVTYDAVAFGVDLALLPIVCAAGPGEWDRVEQLAGLAKKAVDGDPQLAGSVPVVKAGTLTNWRAMNVGGADVLAADLVLEIRM